MRLAAGDTAFAFEAQDINGNEVALRRFKKKKVLLSFHRYASCPFCGMRIYELKQRYATYHHMGLEMVSLFHSAREEVQKYVGAQQPPFAIIADPQQAIYRAYGVETSVVGVMAGMFRIGRMIEAYRHGLRLEATGEQISSMPAEFLLGPGLVVERAYYGSDLGDHLSLRDIEEWLRNRNAA